MYFYVCRLIFKFNCRAFSFVMVIVMMFVNSLYCVTIGTLKKVCFCSVYKYGLDGKTVFVQVNYFGGQQSEIEIWKNDY